MVEEKRARGDVRNFAKEKSRLVVRKAKALEDGDTQEAERYVPARAIMSTSLVGFERDSLAQQAAWLPPQDSGALSTGRENQERSKQISCGFQGF